MAKTLNEMANEVIEFSEARGWSNEVPPELINSIMVELGELAEHYQWKKDFSKFKKMTEEERTALGFEYVDVMFYLLRLAAHSGIDIEYYFYKKLPLLAKKFPIGKDPGVAHREYRKSGKNKLYE